MVVTCPTVVVVAFLDTLVGGVASPSSPWSSSGTSDTKGQLLADVVVAVGVILQPLTRDELVVWQLKVPEPEPEVREVQETKKSVTTDVEHEVVDSFSSGSAPPESLPPVPGGGPGGGPGGFVSIGSRNPFNPAQLM